MESLTPFTPTFILAHARRLLAADEVDEDDLTSEKGIARTDSPSPVVPDVPEHCAVKDLDTGAVFHAEKETKLLLKTYHVADPAKVLSRGWWSPPVLMPAPMMRVQEEEEQLALAAGDSPRAASSTCGSNNSPNRDSFSARGEESSSSSSSTCNHVESAVQCDAVPELVQLPTPTAELTFVRISGTGTVRANAATPGSSSSSGSPYTVYALEVKCVGAEPQQWTVHRRYNAFKALDTALRRSGYRAPMLPPRRLLGQLDPDFVTQRRVDLESWLYQLIDYPNMDPSALSPQNCSTFRTFLLADANNPPFPMDVREEEPGRLEGALTTSGGLWTNEGAIAGSSAGWGTGAAKDRRKLGLDDFELIKVIGKGSFGKVTLVKKKEGGKYYAMKVLTKAHLERSKQVEHTCTERRVLGCINHPFIVSMHYAWTTDAKVYFVLDYCPGGELFFHLSQRKKLPEYMARFYAAEITLALEHLHDNDIVYRDLKPENIILDADGHVKLADFGLAKTGVSESSRGATSLCGTPEYLSPEILNRKGHGTAVDWWSLGMVLYEMLTGLPPWYTTDRKKLFSRLRSGPLHFPFYVSRPAADIISGLLTRDPLKRLGSKRDSEEVKEHRFFASVDWDALIRGSVKAPFDPCRAAEVTDTRNFDVQFTRLPLDSATSESDYLHSFSAPAVLVEKAELVPPRSNNKQQQQHKEKEKQDDFLGFTYRGSALTFGSDAPTAGAGAAAPSGRSKTAQVKTDSRLLDDQLYPR